MQSLPKLIWDCFMQMPYEHPVISTDNGRKMALEWLYISDYMFSTPYYMLSHLTTSYCILLRFVAPLCPYCICLHLIACCYVSYDLITSHLQRVFSFTSLRLGQVLLCRLRGEKTELDDTVNKAQPCQHEQIFGWACYQSDDASSISCP